MKRRGEKKWAFYKIQERLTVDERERLADI